MVKKTDPDAEITQTTVAVEPAPDAPVVTDPVADEATDEAPVVAGHLAAAEAAVQPVVVRRTGFAAAMAGGAVAAVAGFALSHFDVLQLQAPADTSQTVAAIEAQGQDLAALRTEMEQIRTDLTSRVASAEEAFAAMPEGADLAPAMSRIDALETRLNEVEASASERDGVSPEIASSVQALQTRVDELGTATGLPEELSSEVDAALERLAAAEASTLAKTAEAEALANTLRRSAVIDRVAEALAAGQPYGAPLGELGDAVPEALSAHAETGIPSLSALQQSFPDAARAALRVARATQTGDGWGARVTDFLQAQTGARSLSPREGTDPDAVLSRAAAAVDEGRLADAVAEVQSLDPSVTAPLADWVAQATRRIEAEADLSALANQPAPEGEE